MGKQDDPEATLERLSDRDASTEEPSDASVAPPAGGAQPGPDAPGMLRAHPGRYRRGPMLGQGGMGRVVAVHDRLLGRRVARKELLTTLDDSGSSGGDPVRFLREARITAQLEHPGIVPVYEQGMLEDGTLYFTMKEIRGENLAELLSRCLGLG